ncbi:hypothetical protein N7449_010473 [Penicillium cf. viridicatum]|uniref:Uncharacterized protein n=1 Tax=Penicillium cf. viridicatum TaxID=2972119 RepID=A0A9W9M3L1_9EURO|nr:hypothetical protein N7449_010473 [Penicillium cf. viridicatum]
MDSNKLARLASVKPARTQNEFRDAKRNLLRLCAADPLIMSTLAQQPFPDVLETALNDQPENLPKHKKVKLLPDESDEGSIVESSESEIDETRSKGHHQNAKRKDYAKRKGKGKCMSLDSESEDDESSLVNFNPASKTQRWKTKQKATKHNRHNKHSTSHGVRKGRDSPLYTGIKPSSSRARHQNIERNRGRRVTRRRDERCSSRTSHSRAKRKRLGDLSELADTSCNDSDIADEVERRPVEAYTKSASVKARSQTVKHKKLDNIDGLAESPDKNLVGGAMDGLTLEGDAPKINGRTAKTTEENHDGRADSMHENEKSEELDEAHV